MNLLIAGATGFLGRLLVNKLLAQGHRVCVVSRNIEQAQTQFKKQSVEFYPWPKGGQIFKPQLVQKIDVIINLAGESIAGRRWSDAQKNKILNSRVLTTRRLVQSFNTPRLKAFIGASAIGGYASHPSYVYTEDDKLAGATKASFLAKVVQAWEAELQPLKCRKVMLRTGLVLGRKGGAFKQLKTLSQLHLNGAIGGGAMWVSWVHEQDWLQAVVWLLEKPHLTGPFNMTSPQPVQQSQLASAMAQASRPSVCGIADAVRLLQLPAPRWGVRLALGERSQLVLDSHRVKPKKLQQSGFQFKYPKLEAALASLL